MFPPGPPTVFMWPLSVTGNFERILSSSIISSSKRSISLKRIIILTACLASLPAWADNNRGFFAGAGMTYSEAFEYPGVDDPVKVKSVEVLAGYKYNNLLGIEARYGSGYEARGFDTAIPPADEEDEAEIADTEYEIDDYYSIYYKPELINDEARLYGLIGYTSMDRSVRFNSGAENTALVASYIANSPTFDTEDEIDEEGSISTSTSGFSYGIGAGWFVNKHFNINVEYRILLSKSDERISTAGIYFDYRI